MLLNPSLLAFVFYNTGQYKLTNVCRDFILVCSLALTLGTGEASELRLTLSHLPDASC